MSYNTQTWCEHDQPRSNPEDFSTLEVATQPSNYNNDTLKELQSPDNFESTYRGRARLDQYGAPEAIQQSPSPKGAHGVTSPALSPLPASSFGGSSDSYLTEKDLGTQLPRAGRRVCGMRAMVFCLLLTLATVIVLVAVAVPMGLIVGRQRSSSSQSKNPNSFSALSHTGVSDDSSLASIAFNDTQGLVHYRIYYQDNNGTIKESSWNSSGNSWYVSNAAIGSAKPKSPLAAVVTGPVHHPFQINVYAISNTGQFISWGSIDTDWTSGNTTFTIGPLGQEGVLPAATSRLAAVWDRAPGCPECSNTLNSVYQQQNGTIQWGNLTDGAWQWSPLPANAILGSGLAIDLRFVNSTRNILLYYQLANRALSLLFFNGSTSQWEPRELNPVAQIGMNSPIASFAYTDPSSGETLFEEVLSQSVNGTAESTWNTTSLVFSPEHYPPMLQQNYTSIATNLGGHLYLMQGGVIREFDYNLDDKWSSLGNVTTR